MGLPRHRAMGLADNPLSLLNIFFIVTFVIVSFFYHIKWFYFYLQRAAKL